MLVHVAFRISETIAPAFPNKTPTWLDGTTSRAVTDGPLYDRESGPFSTEPSTDLEKTSTTAFCAGENLDSGFCRKTKKSEKGKLTRTHNNKHTGILR